MLRSHRFLLLVFFFTAFFLPTSDAMAEIVFEDDFSAGLGNWTPGTNTGRHSSPDIAVVGGEVVFYQDYDFIELDFVDAGITITDSFQISFEARRTTASAQKWDFLVETVGSSETSGLMRFQWGFEDYYAINIGTAPSTTDGSSSGLGDSVMTCDPSYLQTLDRNGSAHEGTITYTYVAGLVKMAFTNDTRGTIETPWIDTGASTPSQIRIWVMGSSTSPKMLDNVTIEAPIDLETGILIDAAGNLYLGEGDGAPLHVLGNISCTGSLTEGSSRDLKRGISALDIAEAMEILQHLNPVTYYYKTDRTGDQRAGFIAEDVPALVATPDRKGLSAMDLVAILTKVVQYQQQEIEEMKKKLTAAGATD